MNLLKIRSRGYCHRVIGLSIALSVMLHLVAQTSVWIAPGPLSPASHYDPVQGIFIYIDAPPANWSDPANWNTSTTPNGATAVAVLDSFPFSLRGNFSTSWPGAREARIETGSINLSELRLRTWGGTYQKAPTVTIGSDSTSANLFLTGLGLTWQSHSPGNSNAPSLTVENGLLSFSLQATSSGEDTAGYHSVIPGPNITVLEKGRVNFHNQSSLGSSAISIYGGQVEFYDQTTAGSGTLGVSSLITATGQINFHQQSTADRATFYTSGDGRITFSDTATAGKANFIIAPPSSGNPYPSTDVIFRDASNAGQATIEAATLTFSGTASAANATLRNTGYREPAGHGYYRGYDAHLDFFENSTAGDATIFNGGQNSWPGLGELRFQDNSSAGSALIINLGNIEFSGNASLANAHIAASSNHYSKSQGFDQSPVIVPTGRITFKDQATGGSGRIEILSSEAIIDLSGLRTTGAGTDGRAILPSVSTSNPFTPNDARSFSLELISSDSNAANIYLGGTRLRLGSGTLGARVSDIGGAYGSVNGQPLKGGGLDKVSSGTLTISNPDNNYSGITSIQEGTLKLDHGKISSTAISPGASLIGNGTVAGDLMNSGAISPGESLGTITVQGNFTQTNTGSLSLEVTSPTTFDRLVVNGTATLGGSLGLFAPNGFTSIVGNTTLNLLTTGAVTGRFERVILANNLSQSLGAALSSGIAYSPTSVSFQITQLPFATLAGTSPSAVALGAHLDATLNNSSGDFRDLIAALNTLKTTTELAGALAALTPDRYSALAENSFASASFGQAAWDYRCSPLHAPAPRGFNLFFEAGTGSMTLSAASDASKAQTRRNRGTAGGIWHNDAFSVGASLTDETGNTDLDQLNSTAKTQSVVPAIFFQYASDRFFLNAHVARSFDDYDLRRHILSSEQDGFAIANTAGSRTDFSITAGMTYHSGNWNLTPEAGLLNSTFKIDNFSETGAPGANLSISSWSNHSLRSRVGVAAARPSRKFTPQLHVRWLHEFATDRGFSAQFVGATGSSYTAPGRPTETDFVQASLSVDVRMGEAVTGYASIGGAWGKDTQIGPEIAAGVRWQF